MSETVASIISVAGQGFRLSLILNAINCEIANAPPELHEISKTITLFSSTLSQTGNALRAIDSVHSFEATRTAEQVANNGGQVFKEINDMIEKCRSHKTDGKPTPTVQQRFRWSFRRNRINYLLAQLDSLKLSLSLMLQIIQLGKLMAATSKSDPADVVEVKKDEISRERLDVQNVVIVRFMQNDQVEKLYQAYEHNESLPSIELPSSPTSETSSALTIEPPAEYSSTTSLVRLPVSSLVDVDQMMQGICSSPRDMVQVSEKAIDPLLEKWTRWRQIREARHAQNANLRYVPQVDSLHEDEDDVPLHERYPDRDESPRGYYLEGNTTNWREPHSVAARQDLLSRKKQYSNYQPSVSAASSDLEHSPGSNTSRKRQTKRHVINSSPESSDSEYDKSHMRKDSGIGAQDKRHSQEAAPQERSHPRNLPPPPRAPSGQTTNHHSHDGRSTLSPHYVPPSQARPYPTPDQQPAQHSYTSPLPPIYTHNATHAIDNPPQQSGYYQSTYAGQMPGPPLRPYQQQYPPYRAQPPSPVSRDGRRPLPSYTQDERSYPSRSRQRRSSREDKRASRDRKARNLTDGAAKGLLGATAIAGFLEALEGLSI